MLSLAVRVYILYCRPHCHHAERSWDSRYDAECRSDASHAYRGVDPWTKGTGRGGKSTWYLGSDYSRKLEDKGLLAGF